MAHEPTSLNVASLRIASKTKSKSLHTFRTVTVLMSGVEQEPGTWQRRGRRRRGGKRKRHTSQEKLTPGWTNGSLFQQLACLPYVACGGTLCSSYPTMKLAILASLFAATSAFVPSSTGPSMGRSPSTLLRAEFKGAEAISGLTKDVETVFTVEDIAAAIPHRYPFALVDKVIEYEAGKRAVGVKSITNNEPQFTGHFPDKPIFPGVMQVEALAQLAGVVALKMDGVEEGSLFLFGGVDGVKWKKPVVPGDQLVMEVEITKFNAKFGLAKATGKAYVDGQLACEVGQM